MSNRFILHSRFTFFIESQAQVAIGLGSGFKMTYGRLFSPAHVLLHIFSLFELFFFGFSLFALLRKWLGREPLETGRSQKQYNNDSHIDSGNHGMHSGVFL